tara:strand:- start:278 stop:1546 length:1269 start_codon:yes stop_codon:yes gene_type:complete
MRQIKSIQWCAVLFLGVCLLVSAATGQEPFRPDAGKFPPLEKAHSYRGELVFVDHANRRGSIRVEGAGMYFRNSPHPFAMLPYGIVRYHGAPADLRDIPLGTVLHVKAFLPPDPNTSVVPVLPVNNKTRDADHNRGRGIFPAENHVLLLEDEPSYCLRNGLVWKLKELEIQKNKGKLVASRQPSAGKSNASEDETMTFDAATRIWRGRELLSVEDLIADGVWPVDGKKSLDSQIALIGITWKPTPNDIFTRFHISDIWLDDISIQRASKSQTEMHKEFIRTRWLPAWIDTVAYGKFGQATVTATLFGGMDSSLYADFKKGSSAMMNSVADTLKHNHGAYGPSHMACRGPILDVIKTPGEVPLGSSGIQIKFETDLITEGVRPGRVVRVWPGNWPTVNVPREEYINNKLEERFPSPDIFPHFE